MVTYHYLYYTMEMFTHRLPLRNQVEGRGQLQSLGKEEKRDGPAMNPVYIWDTMHTLARALNMTALSNSSYFPLRNQGGTEGEEKREKRGCARS